MYAFARNVYFYINGLILVLMSLIICCVEYNSFTFTIHMPLLVYNVNGYFQCIAMLGSVMAIYNAILK